MVSISFSSSMKQTFRTMVRRSFRPKYCMFAATKLLMTFSKLNHLQEKRSYDQKRHPNGSRNVGASEISPLRLFLSLEIVILTCPWVRFSVKLNGVLNESLRQGKRRICIERFFKSDVTKTSNGDSGTSTGKRN